MYTYFYFSFLFQTLLALSEVINNIAKHKNEYPSKIDPFSFTNLLVLLLGTGSPKNREKYNAEDAAKWGMLTWLKNGDSNPIIDVFSEASVDMVDIYLQKIFKFRGCAENYLRIQVIIIFISLTYQMRKLLKLILLSPLYLKNKNLFFKVMFGFIRFC